MTHMRGQGCDYDDVVDGMLEGKKKFGNITASKLSGESNYS